MEEVKRNSGQALGTAALITGIITFMIAVIPCVGIAAIPLGIVTVILAAFGISQAARDDSPRGLMIASLIIGVVALMISSSQLFIGKRIARHADKFPVEIRNVIKDVKQDVLKDLEDANVNIKIENNGEKIEINASGISADKEKLENQLEELEKGKEAKKDTLPGK